MPDSLQALARLLAAALPAAGLDDAPALLAVLGWEEPTGGADLGLDALDPRPLLAALARLDLAVSAGTDIGVDVGVHAEVLTEVLGYLERLETLAVGLPTRLAGAGDYAEKTRIAAELAPRLLAYLLIRSVDLRQPALYLALVATGVFRLELWRADPAKYQVDHLHHTLDLGQLKLLLTDPAALMRDRFGWGTAAPDVGRLVVAFGVLLQSFGLPASLSALPARVEARLTGGPVPAGDPLPRVLVSFLRSSDGLDVGLSVHGLRPTAPGRTDAGIGFSPVVRGSTDAHIELTEGLTLDVVGLAVVLRGVALLVRPGGEVQVKGGILTGEPGAVTTPIALHFTIGGGAPRSLIALPGGSRLEYQAVSVALGVRPAPGGSEVYVEVGLPGARAVLDLGGAGPLLGALLPSGELGADLDLGIRWAGGRAYLQSGAGLRSTVPVHRRLGPVELETLAFGVDAGTAGALPVDVAARLRASFGPVGVVVDGIGFTASLDLPPGGGNLGPFQLDLGFRPPTGLGVEISAGPVTGGGYLAVDGTRYAGVLQVKLSFLAITAFGIVDEAPGGGVSFVAVLGIRFWPGIQLGFGFAITGVGGLVGMNRTANVDLLRERLATGAAGNVLFCEDPVKNAPTLLGDLDAFFPAQAGSFVVGPTLQISWVPPIVRLDVAVLVELPGPKKIIVLGSVKVLIGADETLALLYLRMDFLGVLDLEQRMVSLDAYLVNSHAMGVFRLTGGMAFRLSYGDHPYVLLSIGGFHPRFDPGPLNLPSIPRVGAVLDTGIVPGAYFRLEMYVAFTSNTLQLGAKVEAGLELGPINAHGYLAFDALIQFRPFAFDIAFSAGFSVEVFDVSLCSVDVDGRLTGPGPLVVRAHASVRLLFVKVSGSVTVSLGSDDADRPQPVPSIVDALAPELSRVENLRAEGEDTSIVLKPGIAVAGVLLSPRGALIWEQKRAPLETLVDRFEGAPLVGRHELALVGPAGWAGTDESDWFSPGTFTSLDLAAAQTMNNATYQLLRSGIRVAGGADVSAPTPKTCTPRIDLIKRPDPTRLSATVGSYLTPALAAMLIERDTTPAVRPGPPKVRVVAETADVHTGTGATVASGQTPFQAFQLSREAAGLLATPNADVVVTL